MPNDANTAAAQPKDPWRWYLRLALLCAVAVGLSVILARTGVPWTVRAWAPREDLPAYHVIAVDDLRQVRVDPWSLTADIHRSSADLAGRYTLARLPAGETIATDKTRRAPAGVNLAASSVLALPATDAMLIGGALRAGEVVTLDVVPPPSEAGPAPIPTSIADVVVLDVKRAKEGDTIKDQAWVVLAIPAASYRSFLVGSPGATFYIRR
jgi:hypothetical protein